MRRFGVAFRERVSIIGLLAGDSGVVALGRQQAARKREDRKRDAAAGSGLLKRIEFLVFFAAGAAATFIVADYVGTALQSLDKAETAMASARGG